MPKFRLDSVWNGTVFNITMKIALSLILVLFLSASQVSAQTKQSWENLEKKAEQAFIDGKLKEAESYWKRALEVAEADETQVLNVATTLNQLNHLYIKTNRFKEGYKDLARALSIRKKHLGENNLLTAETMGNLALLNHKLGHDHEAEELYLEALAIKEKVTGAESHESATTLHNLANLYSLQRKYEKAKQLYERVLALDKKKHGEDHSEVVRDLTSLGINAYRCKRYKEAEEYLLRAKKLASSKSLPYEIELIPIYHYLGLVSGQQDQHKESRTYHKQAHTLGTKVHGKHHPANTIALLNMAHALDKAGEAEEAESVLLEALSHENKRSKKHNYLITEVNLEIGQYYHRHNLDDQAQSFYEEALKTYAKLPNHLKRKLYKLPVSYSHLLKEIGKEKKAETISKKYLHVHTPQKDEHFRME